MSILQSKDDSSTNWKDKYIKLLDSQELLEKEYKSNEELLCKTITRFALAVRGLNKDLDPYFSSIRNLLKNGFQSEKLKDELDAFSSILVKLEENPNHIDAYLLFEFLYERYPQHKEKLELISEQYNQFHYTNHHNLFLAILQSINDEDTNKSASCFDLSDSTYRNIRSSLVRLIDYAGVPEQLTEKAEEIKGRIQADINPNLLAQIFEDTVSLFIDVKKHIAVEQLQMADFLSKLTEELSDLALHTTGVNIANENVIKNRKILDETVSEQMADLQNKSATATQLEPLKKLVNNCLGKIHEQIQSHRIEEENERKKLQEQLLAMTLKVQNMESESMELKTKLDIAQRKATRDPLTRLPNRLAFEDRLSYEMSKWRRYTTPLSMIIWDIDFFKKINDSFGHKSGDKALVVIAQLLAKQCRETDFVARFGGEEFVMLLPDTDAASAIIVAEKLRVYIEKASFKASGKKISITISCGISQVMKGDNHESIFERADKALYLAKQNGRNKCVIL
jgi:diguanylate cyclase